MSSAPARDASSGADISSSSLQTRPMLSPIRTQQPLQSYSAHPSNQPSQRAPSTYPDDPSAHPWGPTPHFAQQNHQAHPPSMHGSLLDNNAGFASSSSHHQNQQQQQSYVVNSNVYLDSPTRSLTPPDSANLYSSSLSPIASTLSMQQQIPSSGKAPKASGRTARGQGKAPPSGARGAAGTSASASAAAAARTAQPKSNRKQFSACGACQLRQSVLSSPR